MDAEPYLENILRERACSLCSADRRYRASPVEDRCAICRTLVGQGDVLFAIGSRAARAVCSTSCLEVALVEGLVDGASCPLCGSRWSDARPIPRACAVCSAPLRPDAGFAGLWRSGRLQSFCGPACLGAYLRRENPFCG